MGVCGRASSGSKGKTPDVGLGLTIFFFCENLLFCHDFKNGIATFAFTAYNMKWKKNQFGGRKVE